MQRFRHSLLSTALCILFTLLYALQASAQEENADIYLDKSRVVQQQIDVLKNRLTQAELELTQLHSLKDRQKNALTTEYVNKKWLEWEKLNLEEARSNLDSINVEVAEAQQTIAVLEKDLQEIDNQLNVLTIFGVKVAHNGLPNRAHLIAQQTYQQNILNLEKQRLDYLQKLRDVSDEIGQSYAASSAQIETLLKMQNLVQLKGQHAKSELDLQQQQTNWLKHLQSLYAEQQQMQKNHTHNLDAYKRIQNEIAYANENVNFLYLQMLLMRYQTQLQQLKVSISESSSITFLNKISEQTQALTKQLARLKTVLHEREEILQTRKNFLKQDAAANAPYLTQVGNLATQYADATATLNALTTDLTSFRASLDQALQQEISARQGLLGFGAKAWLDVGNEILLVPGLAFQICKSLIQATVKAVSSASHTWWLLLGIVEIIWLGLYKFCRQLLTRLVVDMPDHALGHINLRWLFIKVLQRNLWALALLGNIYWFFNFCQIPPQHYNFVIAVGLVLLLYQVMISVARLTLYETVQDKAGSDVRLYYRLKWTLIVGGIITAITVFIAQLPLVYEVKDLFTRLFLVFICIVSILLLKSWDVVPGLILPHIDEKRTYFRRVVYLLGILIPLLILVNSLLGVFGFVNFVYTISWYESVFMLVLIAYLLLRGYLSDGMEYVSRLMIRHVTNGWLWTEAFLKPIDQVLRLLLFLCAWVVLFFFYGWGRESPVVERINNLLHYHLFDILNTTITPINILSLLVVISLLYWAARWTREFVYRFLLYRTKDLGVRNSVAILSQYAMILLGVFIGLHVLGIDFRALTVVAGAFAVGIGLGLRDIANNFVCGFLLLFERPLRVGDTVSIGDYEGEVMHIGGRAVTIRTWDHMEVMVPNADIFSKSFTNWTAKDYIVRTVVTMKVQRHDNPHQVQALIYQTLAGIQNVLSDPAPEVFLKELIDELMEFEVRYYINLRQVRSRIGVRSEALIAIWEAFDQHGIKPPYAHYEIRLDETGKTDV